MIAFAKIQGSPLAPNLQGKVLLRDILNGVEICVEITGLPEYKSATSTSPQVGPHGFHLHITGNCEIGDSENPFLAAGEHYNPTNSPYGSHAGDFPALFSNNGYFRMCFYTNKFSVFDTIGKSIIIHEGPDDYCTEFTDNAGKRIGCGIIKELNN